MVRQIQKMFYGEMHCSFKKAKKRLNKCVFKCFSKVELCSMSWRSVSRLFHASGPTRAKARSPSLD